MNFRKLAIRSSWTVLALLALIPLSVSAQTVTTRQNFNGTDGALPWGKLLQGTDGNFYGTTQSGGTSTACPIFPQASGCGGTSMAAPMFSALWAIATQEAQAPLGQAAPYLYSMPAGIITDIVPLNSSGSITASVQDSSGTTKYTADQVAGVKGPILDAMWDYPYDLYTLLGITFGTDSGLTVTKGWDNVTGMGVPNGAAFANYFLYSPGTFVIRQ